MAALFATGFASTALADKRVALIVANGGYKGAALANPIVDADLVASSLQNIGFTVKVVKNADLGTFDAAVTAFADDAQGAEVALFYFAGHGFTVNEGVRPVSMLMSTSADVTSNSDRILRSGGIALDEIVGGLIGKAQATLVFVDACRSDPRVSRAVGGQARGFAPLGLIRGGNLFIGLSTRLGTVARDGVAGMGSPFARAFAVNIQTKGMRIDDEFRMLRDAVKSETQGDQLPDIVQDDLPNGAITLVAAPREPPAPAAPADAGSQPPPAGAPTPAKLVEAAQVWATLRDSNDSDALSMFSTQYAGIFYAKLAEHRLKQIEGVAKITSFFETYIGKSAALQPALVVTPEGSDYLVTTDLGAPTSPFKAAGIGHDSAAFHFKVSEQEDAAWRVEFDNFPTYHANITQSNDAILLSASARGIKSTTFLDTQLEWIRSGQTRIEDMAFRGRLPGIDATVSGGPLQATITTQPSPDGAVSTNAQESVGALDVTVVVDPKVVDLSNSGSAQPFNANARFDSGSLEFKLDGVKPHPLLDLWAFLVAHPSRPELAADEAAFKTLLTAALPAQSVLAEDFAVQKLSVQTPQGTFALDGAKVATSVAAAGASSRFEQHYAATGVALPPGLVPAPYRDFVPTSFDLRFKVAGVDLTAAGTEAIADMHLAGDVPPVSAEDEAKISAKLLGAGPLVIDIPSSHIRAPQLDLGFEGQIRYPDVLGAGKATGTIAFRAHNFDQTTAAALKVAAGPEGEKKLIPVIAMVKGLAKTDPDGVMTWVCEIGDDRILKVNGMSLGVNGALLGNVPY
ncbi:MAG TPA: caspase family protein [Roseiarcus sp.]